MRYRYGITPEDYDRVLQHQGGVCAICKSPPKNVRLHIDHEHGTNTVRGLLCYQCNRLLGHLEKHQDRYLKYLEGSLPEQTVALTELSATIRPR